MSKEYFYNIIRRPIITEKATLAAEQNTVLFIVARDASKTDIKKSIEGLFGVEVSAVNTLIRKGKKRRFRGKTALLSDIKRAYVTLKAGHKLDVTTGL